jgi:hypothetical protein
MLRKILPKTLYAADAADAALTLLPADGSPRSWFGASTQILGSPAHCRNQLRKITLSPQQPSQPSRRNTLIGHTLS